MTPRGVVAVAAAIAGRPSLWWTALVQGRRMLPHRWWARAPFLPVPDRAYVQFRTVTQYGDPSHPLVADDVLQYLSWCRNVGR
jgi:hypothetical protein